MSLDLAVVSISGAAFVCACIVLAIRFPYPTPFQMFVFRTVLGLSAAGAAAAIPGFLSVALDGAGIAVRAGGALAVFAVVYRLNPATLISSERVFGELRDIKGTLASLEEGLEELSNHAGRSLDNDDKYIISRFMHNIADAIDLLIEATERKRPRDEHEFERACAMISQYLSEFARRWDFRLPIDRLNQIVDLLHRTERFPGKLRIATSRAEIKRNAIELSRISGRIRAMAHAFPATSV